MIIMKYESTQPCYIVMGLCTMKSFTDSKSTCNYRSTAKPHTMHKTEQHIYIWIMTVTSCWQTGILYTFIHIEYRVRTRVGMDSVTLAIQALSNSYYY